MRDNRIFYLLATVLICTVMSACGDSSKKVLQKFADDLSEAAHDPALAQMGLSVEVLYLDDTGDPDIRFYVAKDEIANVLNKAKKSMMAKGVTEEQIQRHLEQNYIFIPNEKEILTEVMGEAVKNYTPEQKTELYHAILKYNITLDCYATEVLTHPGHHGIDILKTRYDGLNEALKSAASASGKPGAL